MPAGRGSRTQVWLDSLGDWSWPGRAGGAAEVLPPSWVPASPPRLEPAALAPATPASSARAIPRARGLLLGVLAAACATVALNGPLGVERLVGLAQPATVAFKAPPLSNTIPTVLPTLNAAGRDRAGSAIDSASYTSPALHGHGAFLVYLPPGYATTSARYPVIYLLHGNNQPDSAFLQVGLQRQLDRLIAQHTIAPLIAVMIQGGPGANNWRNADGHDYESYVLEVQQLVDRMLPTVAARNARAIAGDSMGGYGAMNLTLGHPYRFSVVESWLGFFNGLQNRLRAATPVLRRLGLQAYLYGGASDHIADPSEDPAFAASLRTAGVSARGTIYPGEHSLETIEEHLATMLAFAGRAFATAATPTAAPAGASPAAPVATPAKRR
jgi:Putative esterase